MATRRQMKAHVIRYPCRLCGSSFQTEQDLKEHFKSHIAINNPLGKTGIKKVQGHHLPMTSEIEQAVKTSTQDNLKARALKETSTVINQPKKGPVTKKPCNRVINLKNEQVALAKGKGQDQGESSGESVMVKDASSGDQDKKLGKEYEA